MKTDKKNILLVFDGFRTGGIVSLNIHLFKTISTLSNEYNFYLLCSTTKASKNDDHQLFSFCKDIFSYIRRPNTSSLYVFFETIFNTRRLMKKMAQNINIDFVVLNHPYSSLGVILSRVIRRDQAICFFHGAWYLERDILHRFTIKNQTGIAQFEWGLVRSFYQLAQTVMLVYSQKRLCCSNYAKNLLQEAFGITKNAMTVHIPHINSQHANSKNNHQYKKNIGLDINQLVFLIPSRFEPRKGIHLLINAISILQEKTKKRMTFLLMGPLPQHSQSYFFNIFKSMQIKNSTVRAYFINSIVDKRELYRYYLAADAILMPSVGLETLGMVTLEALSLGIPVMSMPSGATEEILLRINKNLIAKKITGLELANTIYWFSKLSEEKKNLLRIACITYVKKYHNVKKSLANIDTIFRNEYY